MSKIPLLQCAALAIVLALTPGRLLAAEIYYATTTPESVATALVGNAPDSTAQSGGLTNKFKAFSGPGLLPGGTTFTPEVTFSDSPANYTVWENGSNGGQGFGPWSVQLVTTNAGFFLGDTLYNTNMNVGTARGFGLWANSGGRSAASRTFATPMKAGDRFSVQIDNNWIVNGSQVGVKFYDSNGTVRLGFLFVGGESTYRVLDASGHRSTSVPYTDGGMTLALALGAGDSYTLTTGLGTVTGNLSAGGPVSRVEFFNSDAGPDSLYNFYFGAMSHVVAGVAVATVLDPPTSSAGVRLLESAISPVIASAAGYKLFDSFASDALASAKLSLEGSGTGGGRIAGASEYRYGMGQDGGTNANWNIQFDGVPPKTPSLDTDNFIPAKIDEAIANARVAIRANPFTYGQGSGYALLVQAAYENTVPHTYAGNEWRAQADKERLEPSLGKTIYDRIATLEKARDQYLAALSPLHALLNHPLESAYLWDAPSYILDAKPQWAGPGQTWTSLLYDAHANAIRLLAECQADLASLRYLAAYQVPGTGTFDPQPLVRAATAAAAEIDRLILPLGALAQRAGLEPREEVADALAYSSRLKKLSLEFAEKCISFDAGKSQESGNAYVRRTYGPYDVPFYSQDVLFGSSLTFNNLISIAAGSSKQGELVGGLIADSATQDANATNALFAVIDSSEKLLQLRQGVEDNYLPQLHELCGARHSDPQNLSSDLVPDIMGYLLPPADRPALAEGESYGSVYEQFKKIEQADNRLLSAIQNLAQVDDEIQVIRTYGAQRLQSFDRIYKIQLDTGKEISALDYLSGEIRAEAIRAEAEARANSATKSSFLKAIASGFNAAGGGGGSSGGDGSSGGSGGSSGSGGSGGSSGGSSGSGGAAIFAVVKGSLTAFVSWSSAQDEAKLYREVGRIQANSAVRLAQIQAQQTRLRAIESATITQEGQVQEQSRIDEQIHKLMITVESRRLEILYAEQSRDLAQTELGNLIGRVGYVMQEYRKALVRQANTTLNRPDLRLRRDYAIREADRIFRFAQEYCYLSARAAEYRFLTTAAQSAVRTQTANILKAQNAKGLKDAATQLVAIRDTFAQSQQGRATLRRVRLSLRNYVIQSNQLDGYLTLNGSWAGGIPPDAQFLHYPDSSTGTPTSMAALSDEQFTTYLRNRLVGHSTLSKPGGPSLPRPYVDIVFRTGYEKDFGERSNPLYVTGEFGHLIESPGLPLNDDNAAGVFVNIRNNRSSLVATDTVSVQLEQQGVSFVPYQSLPNDLTPVTARAWNLPAVTASLPFIWNADTANTSNWRALASGSAQLNERSPACQRWVLRISGSQTFWTQMLSNIRDIELCMTVRGWTGQGLGTPPTP